MSGCSAVPGGKVGRRAAWCDDEGAGTIPNSMEGIALSGSLGSFTMQRHTSKRHLEHLLNFLLMMLKALTAVPLLELADLPEQCKRVPKAQLKIIHICSNIWGELGLRSPLTK